MSTAEQVSQPLVTGEKLSREEFLRRWEALPELKFAELLEGVVYVPSPLSISHGSSEVPVVVWLGYYAGFTPGCEAASNTTWLMLEDAPQPDCCLRILPEHGGQSGVERGYGCGAPELIVEVSVSSAARDLGPKLRLYCGGGVQEYITVLIEECHVIWRRRVSGAWAAVEPDSDGLFRSGVFPGLWLDPAALLRKDVRRLTEVVNQGLRSPEHREFVGALRKRS
ncbi:MAG: Uma2 family endonuclease [Acidobacteria bacterium]|nr:Uma2 family endonuclease [Acidobacteriota bacterium]